MKIIKRRNRNKEPIYKIWEAQDKAHGKFQPVPISTILSNARKQLEDNK